MSGVASAQKFLPLCTELSPLLIQILATQLDGMTLSCYRGQALPQDVLLHLVSCTCTFVTHLQLSNSKVTSRIVDYAN